MKDWDVFKETCEAYLGVDHEAESTFEHGRLNVTIESGGYGKDKIFINDPYMGDERKYRVGDTVEDVVEDEKKIDKHVQLAKNLEETDEINGWTKVEPDSPKTYFKFVSMTKEVKLRLNYEGKWKVSHSYKSHIREGKYSLVKEMCKRNPLAEVLNETVKDTLEEHLQNIHGIGDALSRKLARKSVPSDEKVESMDDIRFYHPKHARYSITDEANEYFESLGYDPVKEAVQQKKRELVQEEGEVQIAIEAL